jgi:hypothetical protein
MTDEHEPGDGQEHEHAPAGERNIGFKVTVAGVDVSVDHLYDTDAEPCPGCGGRCGMAGMVGLSLEFESPDPEAEIASWEAGVVLSPEEALWLANRLRRAADVCYEMTEDPPDVRREVIRLSTPAAPPQ